MAICFIYSLNMSLRCKLMHISSIQQNKTPDAFVFLSSSRKSIQTAVECTCTSMKALSPIELSKTCCIAYMEIAFPAALITARLWRRGFIEVYCIAHYLVTFTSRLICEKNSQPFSHPADLICMDSWQHQIALQTTQRKDNRERACPPFLFKALISFSL